MTTATCPLGHVHEIECERQTVGHAYARNGNMHRPTPRFLFSALVDGKSVASQRLRRDAVAVAVEYVESGEVHDGHSSVR